MVSLDWQDVFFHVLVLQSHRLRLRFKVGQEYFQLAVLFLGITSAPRVFTKVIAVVATHFQRLGVAVFLYLDDWLLKAGSPQSVANHIRTMADHLGFTINDTKSHLISHQRLPFIGAILDTVEF